MGCELTLAERLRVCAALSPDGFNIHLDRDSAHSLIRMLEQRDRVASADKWVHCLLADRDAWFDRQIRNLDRALFCCLGIAGLPLVAAILIGGWA